MVGSTVRIFAATIALLALSDIAARAQSAISINLNEGRSMRQRGVTVEPAKVKTGAITLNVKNSSKHQTKTVAVVPMREDRTELLLRRREANDHSYAPHSIAGVAEVEPGATVSLTVDLKPGTYVVTSNLQGPYLNGMWTVLVVE